MILTLRIKGFGSVKRRSTCYTRYTTHARTRYAANHGSTDSISPHYGQDTVVGCGSCENGIPKITPVSAFTGLLPRFRLLKRCAVSSTDNACLLCTLSVSVGLVSSCRSLEHQSGGALVKPPSHGALLLRSAADLHGWKNQQQQQRKSRYTVDRTHKAQAHVKLPVWIDAMT